MKVPRVAIIGVALESNRQAPPAGESDFASAYIMRGQDILEDARAEHPRIMREASAFVRAMDATGAWEPIPLLLAACHPHGPIEAGLHRRFLAEIEEGLKAAGRLEAVYVANHGAMVAIDGDDPGTFAELLRAAHADAARKGLRYLAVGFASRHPLLPVARRLLRQRTTVSTLYVVHWEDGEEAVAALDGRVMHCEVALL